MATRDKPLPLKFGSEEACEAHMVSLRWPGGLECPRCRWQLSATSGTAIAHTRLPLAKWFRAAYMVCAVRVGRF
ncbi:MAG: transposase [Atopobiaceae bacterium]|nr:transposase [Atopobiaceae bacterium]